MSCTKNYTQECQKANRTLVRLSWSLATTYCPIRVWQSVLPSSRHHVTSFWTRIGPEFSCRTWFPPRATFCWQKGDLVFLPSLSQFFLRHGDLGWLLSSKCYLRWQFCHLGDWRGGGGGELQALFKSHLPATWQAQSYFTLRWRQDNEEDIEMPARP